MRFLPAGTIFILLSIFVWIFGCETAKVKPQNQNSEATWMDQMQDLDTAMKDLIPLIYDQQAFFDKENQPKISSSIETFAKSVHKISPEKSKELIGEDPLFNFSLNRFKYDLDRAKEGFELGHKDHARSVLKSVVGHCFRCHTRTTVGPEFKGGKLDFNGLKLSRLEKSDLLVASRRYDEALTLLEEVIDGSGGEQTLPFEVERGLRRYLSLIVRVRKDPQPALVRLEKLLEKKSTPFYLIEDIRRWQVSLNEWKKQLANPNKQKSLDYLKMAKASIQRGHYGQDFRKDHGSDVDFLLATSYLHDGLTHFTKTSQKVEAYYLLGEAYEVLGDLGFWNLHEFYFESCIREWPNGPLSRKCFSRLEESVLLGYSGSSGVHIPFHERRRLNELRGLIGVESW